MSNENIHIKLAEVLEAVGTNANQISKQLGFDRPDKFYKLLKGAAKPSFSTIAEIISLYPQINANYFFKEGVPVFENSSTTTNQPPDLQELESRHLKEKINLLEKQNQELLEELKRNRSHIQQEKNE